MSKKYCVVAVEKEQHQQLKDAEKITGIPISRMVSEALGAYLTNEAFVDTMEVSRRRRLILARELRTP